MTCKICGTENSENAKFCIHCGKPLTVPEIKLKKERLISEKAWVDIIIIVVMCGAVMFAILYQYKDYLYIKFSDNSITEELKPDYIKVAEKCVKAAARNDINSLLEVFPIEPLGTWGELIEQMLIKEFEDDPEQYEIVDQEVVCNIIGKKDRSEKDLADLKNQYMEDWGVTVSNAKRVKMEARYAGSTEKSMIDVFLIEIEGKWYIDIENFDQMKIK